MEQLKLATVSENEKIEAQKEIIDKQLQEVSIIGLLSLFV